MSIISSPELFINMRRIPDKNSVEYDSFFEEEKRKITYGVTIDDIYISGWLYWHINHWHIYKDDEDEIDNSIIQVWGNPDLRDNEWLIAEYLHQAEQQKKGLMIFGSRRLGKTEFESSYIGRAATLYQGSQNIITGGNWDDIDLIVGRVDKGLSAMHPYFKFSRIGDDMRKGFSLGLKTKKGNERIEWSKILIRNLEDGRKTEKIAGTTTKSFLLDECGKFDFIQAFNAAKPSFTSRFGWRCSPILTGTSGQFKRNSDAQKVFENPSAHNFLAIELKNEPKKYGLFIPGTKRQEGKVETTFGEFIKNEKGILLPKDSELINLPFYDTDEEKALTVINEEIKQAETTGDPKDVLKVKMYFPLNIRDLFLVDDDNIFPVEALKQHLEYLSMIDYDGEYYTFNKGIDGKPILVDAPNTLRPIQDFPAKKDSSKDAPVIIYEKPIPDPPPGLYIAGADPYNQSESVNSPSLGVAYIYKRVYDVVGGTFQDSIVASLAARPYSMNKWHETVELLLDYYNAVCMPENEGGTFIQYFDQRNKAHRLADGYNMLKEITPHTSVQASRNKGLPATKGVIKFWMSLIKEYLVEEIQVGTDPQTSEPIMKMGLVRIKDKMLIKELIAYTAASGNYDRIVAFGHALAYDHFLKKYYPIVKVQQKEESSGMDTSILYHPFIFKTPNPFNMKK